LLFKDTNIYSNKNNILGLSKKCANGQICKWVNERVGSLENKGIYNRNLEREIFRFLFTLQRAFRSKSSAHCVGAVSCFPTRHNGLPGFPLQSRLVRSISFLSPFFAQPSRTQVAPTALNSVFCDIYYKQIAPTALKKERSECYYYFTENLSNELFSG